MNSDECNVAVVATDGGPWWVGDEEYNEPNGNWDTKCFLAGEGIPSATEIANGSFIYFDDQR